MTVPYKKNEFLEKLFIKHPWLAEPRAPVQMMDQEDLSIFFDLFESLDEESLNLEMRRLVYSSEFDGMLRLVKIYELNSNHSNTEHAMRMFFQIQEKYAVFLDKYYTQDKMTDAEKQLVHDIFYEILTK